MVTLETEIIGTPVIVPRLAYRAGIDEMAGTWRHLDRPASGLFARVVDGANLVPLSTIAGKPPLHMGVAEEGQVCSHLLQGGPSVPHVEDVLVFIQRRTMDAGDLGVLRGELLRDNRTLSEVFQPLQVGRRKLLLCPERGCPGHGVEGERGGCSAADAVVISPDN
jgi:hypothetical protein